MDATSPHRETAALAAFRADARRWIRANMPAGEAPSEGPERGRFVREWLGRQCADGWAGITWPSEYGGKALSTLEQIVWFEEYALADAPSTHDASFVGLNHAGPTLIACGSEAQKSFHLPRILNGQSIWCQGFSEPNAGSDLASLRTHGWVEEDVLIVNGQKTWCSYADMADYQELLIRTDPVVQKHRGLSWVICPMDLPGITIRPIRTMAGPAKFAEVFYDDVRIPIDHVVGGLNNGWKVAMSTLGFERGTASLALQISLVLKVERMIAHARLANPALAEKLAVLRAETCALRAMSYGFALRGSGAAPGSEGSLIRLYFAELTQRVAACAIDLVGLVPQDSVYGDDWVFDYLDACSETIAGGTAEIQRNIIAERVLGLPREARA